MRFLCSGRSFLAALLLLFLAGCAGRQRPYQGSLEEAIPAPDGRLAGRLVMLDPGHGGRFAGAVAADGTREADVNLGVALELARLLRAEGARVTLTRERDEDLLAEDGGGSVRRDLLERVARTAALKPDLFVSIHHNSRPGKVGKFNRTEVYHRLADPGPSRDAAVRIQQHLASALNLPDPPLLRAGNYLVLRRNPGTAVLGEASYLTSRGMGQRLRDPAAQRLEAEAYFLGILDYLQRGLPTLRLVPTAPRQKTDVETEAGAVRSTAGAPRQLRLTPESGLPQVEFLAHGGPALDPQSVRVELDARPLAHSVFGERIAAEPETPWLTPGPHLLRVSARNQRGNATPTLEQPLWVEAAVERVSAVLPQPLLQGGPAVPLLLNARTAQGDAVADGSEITLRVEGGRIVDGPTRTRNGVARAWVQPLADADEVHIEARAGSAGKVVLREMLPVREPGAAGLPLSVHVVADGKGLPGAWVALGDAVSRTDRLGRALLGGGDEHGSRDGDRDSGGKGGDAGGSTGRGTAELRVRAGGYAAFACSVPAPAGDQRTDEILCRLRPIAAELMGAKIVIDPALGGDESGRVGRCGEREADLNLAVGRFLADYLRRAGATVQLTREKPWQALSGVDRVLQEGDHPATLFLTLRHDLVGGPVRIHHYPSSANGRRAAYLLAEEAGAWARVGGESVDASDFTLLMTAGPAVVVHLPGAGTETTGESSCSALLEPSIQRQEAWALFRAVVRYLRGEGRSAATDARPVVAVAAAVPADPAVSNWWRREALADEGGNDPESRGGIVTDEGGSLLLLDGMLPLAANAHGQLFRPWLPGRGPNIREQ